jgi:hypothetical protein
MSSASWMTARPPKTRRVADTKIARTGDDLSIRPHLTSMAPRTTHLTQKESVMRKHHKTLLTATGAIAAASTIAITGIAAAAAAPATQQTVSGTEHVQVMSTSTTSTTGSAIAYGAFTAAGTAHLGSAKVGTVVFPAGVIKLSHRPGKGTTHFNPKTCLAVISQPGTYTIVSGTGAYAGITGHGTYQLNLTFIASRSTGKCSSTQPPVAEQELLRLSGPVHL